MYIDLANNPLKKRKTKHVDKEKREYHMNLTITKNESQDKEGDSHLRVGLFPNSTIKLHTCVSHQYDWNKYLEHYDTYTYNFKTQLLKINIREYFKLESTKEILAKGDKDYNLYLGKIYDSVFKIAWKKYKSTKKRKWIDEFETFVVVKKLCK